MSLTDWSVSPYHGEARILQVEAHKMLQLGSPDQKRRCCRKPGEHRVRQKRRDRPHPKDAHDDLPQSDAERESDRCLNLPDFDHFGGYK